MATSKTTSPRNDPYYRLEFMLHAVSRSLARAYNEQFRKLGLSQSQAGVLLQVDWGETFTQTEIAKRLGIGKAAAGALIIDLESQGFLRRKRHAGDARMMQVTLTATGRRKVEQIMSFVDTLAPQLRAGIDEGELERAVAVMAQLRANVRAMGADEPGEASA